MNFVDRILTIVATATITSAVWIVAGGSLLEMADSESQLESTRPAEAAPSPTPAADAASDSEKTGESSASEPAKSLDTVAASNPDKSEAAKLMVPVLNVRPSDLTDTFADQRRHGEKLHEAIDIMAPEGTSVVAAGPGTIEKIYESDAGGKTIYVRSTDGLTIHFYAHLDEYADGLNEGQRVRRGQRLGTVGSTGNASPKAPHLHFAILRTTKDAEWWEPANAVNPYILLTQ
ncbi:M23 family metallopeptidase [Pontixanthobacter aquaemixtae]|uniref:Peptidoglycan DD-metalloendopeptidase family protein n=1 Tax=Pontixanthobacter aquaemixtae TaxID=1958940 RepID=A0A844ZQH4_9SPHN|nr:M23 family metallopeptidase [Pontixanthobacter aquaemixtae]MXO90105.1 peptidoglycan DD-metalloendopeptidase family protein [Pontixanthobacter aquaemixtae]